MELTFYPADFATGNLYGRALPLQDVQLSSSLDAGTFSASLDMRKVARDIDDATQVLAGLNAGTFTIVPVYEGILNGAAGATTRAVGEWWIYRVTVSHNDPIVRFAGIEFGGYAKYRHNTTRWVQSDYDAVVAIRDAHTQLCKDGQDIQITTNSWNARDLRCAFDYPAGTRTYWDMVSDFVAGRAEWRIETRLTLDDITPIRAERWLRVGVPTITIPRDDQYLEATQEGVSPASVTDTKATADVLQTPSVIHARGSGTGDGQLTATAAGGRPDGVPIVSAAMSVPEALDQQQLVREVWAAHGAMRPEQQPFTARIARFVPLVGEVYPWERSSSWAMPGADTGGRIRCVAWSWSQPDAGGRDEYELQLLRM